MKIDVDKLKEKCNKVSQFQKYMEEAQHDHNRNKGHRA